MKSYVKGLWLIALSLIILSLTACQSFSDNPVNWMRNNLGSLPQPNPRWWEDKERMRMLGETFAEEDRGIIHGVRPYPNVGVTRFANLGRV